MTINRHNYEEFFLLYADDELNHQQRAAVELFVQQNPDMAAELEMTQQMKLEPESIMFPDKSSLYKTTDVEINIHNYGGFFFLYIDRELDETAKAKVEKFVLQHPQLQEEFTLLKQTVLQPEAIVFADKSSLYRKEERKVAYIGFMRIAVAAAVIGIAVLGWWLYPTGPVKPEHGLVVTITNPPTQPKVNPVVPPVVTTPVTGTPNTVAVVKQNKEQHKTITPLIKVNSNVQKAQEVVIPKNDVTAYNQPVKNPVDTVAKVNNAVAAIGHGNDVTTGKVESTNIASPVINAVEKQNDKNPPANAIASNTPVIPYRVIDTDEENRSMYVGSLELNKDKIRGFFKKAGRLFGSRAKKDTD